MINYAGHQIKYYWHVHHDTLIERAFSPIEERIEYIRNHKTMAEIPLRLHLLKEAKIRDIFLDNIILLHKEQCDPHCPWSTSLTAVFSGYGTFYGTIFTRYEESIHEYALSDGSAPWRKV